MTPTRRPWYRRALRAVLTWPLALILLFEEWGWERLAHMLAALGRLPGLRWIEGRVRALPPYAALALFAVPLLSLLPIKILALHWLANGHKALGLGLIILAKLVGTAVTARLFALTQPALMKLAWFARFHARWMVFKTRVMQQVRDSRAWQAMSALKRRVSVQGKRVLRAVLRRWRA